MSAERYAASYWLEMGSPVGPLRIGASALGLTAVIFERGRDGLAMAADADDVTGDDDAAADAAAITARAAAQLSEYFAGRRRVFDLPLAPSGTSFQREVWSALCDIPFGETTSYGTLAIRVGRPGGARAVGLANGANPISIVVPCHRVIGASGKLVGYGGGLDVKRTLLALEEAQADTLGQRQMALLAPPLGARRQRS